VPTCVTWSGCSWCGDAITCGSCLPWGTPDSGTDILFISVLPGATRGGEGPMPAPAVRIASLIGAEDTMTEGRLALEARRGACGGEMVCGPSP
jgi:hypothetical protein